MNKKQKELLDKEFKVNDESSITRGDYEGLPCPMIAFTWTDDNMEALAKNIAVELSKYRYSSSDEETLQEEKDDAFWKEMENCAVSMGMAYYEDLSEFECDNISRLWDSIK